MIELDRRSGEKIGFIVGKETIRIAFGQITGNRVRLRIDLPNNCSLELGGLKYTPTDKPQAAGATYREIEIKVEE